MNRQTHVNVILVHQSITLLLTSHHRAPRHITPNYTISNHITSSVRLQPPSSLPFLLQHPCHLPLLFNDVIQVFATYMMTQYYVLFYTSIFSTPLLSPTLPLLIIIFPPPSLPSSYTTPSNILASHHTTTNPTTPLSNPPHQYQIHKTTTTTIKTTLSPLNHQTPPPPLTSLLSISLYGELLFKVPKQQINPFSLEVCASGCLLPVACFAASFVWVEGGCGGGRVWW